MLDFNDAPPLKVIDTEDFNARLERLRGYLQDHAGDLVREIFPLARLSHHEARVGSVDGEAGESLSIGLAGDRPGVWFDHATGEGGDLIDLWQTSQHCDFMQAVEDLEKWAGFTKTPRFASPVARVAKQRAEAAEKTSKPDQGLGAPVASYHYYSADGALLGIVRRYLLAGQVDEVTGKPKKTFRPTNAKGEAKMPDPRPLYRLPQIKTASTVVLVEGEKCADALERVGIEATTAMGGAKANPEKTDWSPLAGKTVTIWKDNDESGDDHVERVRPHLEAIGCEVRVLALPPGKPPKWDAADAVAEGEDVAAILAAAEPQKAPPEPETRRRLPILSRAQMRDQEPPDYLIDETITERSVVAVYGPSGSLKSFVAIDFGMSVAHGAPWQGRETKRGPVVYVTGEGTSLIGQRLDAWDEAHGLAGVDAPFYLLPLGLPISEPTWVEALVADVRALGIKPVMLWLDTLARTFGAGDENSQKDMNAYIRGVDTLRDAFGCVVGIVHHTGKDGDRGLRGSSALYAAMDTVIRTERKDMAVTLKNQQPHGKQKDGAEFDDIPLVARVIELPGLDRKGRKLTSLALFAADPTDPEDDEGDRAERAPSPNAKPQGANQIAVVKALKAAKGEPLGLTRLCAMTRLANSKVFQAIPPLVAKGLVAEIEDGGVKRWSLA